MSVDRVKKYFSKFNMEDRVLEFDESSATVSLAAKALNTEEKRICKTLSFYGENGTTILVQTAGDTKVDNKKFKEQFNIKAKMLSIEDVVKYTGYQIGGVCAFDIDNENVKIYIDESIKRFDTVFPACGSSNSAIELTIDELVKYSNSLGFIDVCKLREEE